MDVCRCCCRCVEWCLRFFVAILSWVQTAAITQSHTPRVRLGCSLSRADAAKREDEIVEAIGRKCRLDVLGISSETLILLTELLSELSGVRCVALRRVCRRVSRVFVSGDVRSVRRVLLCGSASPSRRCYCTPPPPPPLVFQVASRVLLRWPVRRIAGPPPGQPRPSTGTTPLPCWIGPAM